MRVEFFEKWVRRVGAHCALGAMVGLAGMMPTSASAWVATAIDDQGHTFTYGNAETADDARAHALARCLKARGEAAGCQPWAAANAKSIVIAKGIRSTGEVEVVETNHEDPIYAAEGALAHCAKRARDCRIVLAEWDRGPTWASAARAGNRIAVSLDNSTELEARTRALEECQGISKQGSECEVIGPATRSGQSWYSQAHQAGEGIANRETGLFVSPTSLADAERKVLMYCGEDYGACELTHSGEKKGVVEAVAELKQVQAQVQALEAGPAHYFSAR